MRFAPLSLLAAAIRVASRPPWNREALLLPGRSAGLGGGNHHHSVLRQGEREVARRRRQIERGLIHPIFPANP